jgi:hypothetical protein
MEVKMSNFSGAYYVVNGVAFAVLLVTNSSVSSQKAIEDATAYFGQFIPGVPIILATQLPDRRLKFWGEPTITKYLANSGDVRWSNWSFK